MQRTISRNFIRHTFHDIVILQLQIHKNSAETGTFSKLCDTKVYLNAYSKRIFILMFIN